MPDAIDAVEGAFRELARGTVDMPQRPTIRVPEHHGVVLFMPALIGGQDALGVKVVTVYPDNPAQHDMPTVLGVILLNDPTTGEVVSIMDGGYITAMRTGAVSGVATKHMAREDATIASIFGGGVQAKTQLQAVAEVRPLQSALVYDIIPDQAAHFATEMSELLGVPVRVAAEPREAVEGVDIVCTASSAAEPVFSGAWLSPGAHINGIGSHAPHMRELDTETVRRSRVVVDLESAAWAEAGDLMIPLEAGEITRDHIVGDLGQVVAGDVAGRTSPDDVTLFKSEGLAIQDVAVARKVYDLALEQGAGQEVDLSA
jgi:ornithine cyclodeaminase/alanine dehydrogenase